MKLITIDFLNELCISANNNGILIDVSVTCNVMNQWTIYRISYKNNNNCSMKKCAFKIIERRIISLEEKSLLLHIRFFLALINGRQWMADRIVTQTDVQCITEIKYSSKKNRMELCNFFVSTNWFMSRLTFICLQLLMMLNTHQNFTTFKIINFNAKKVWTPDKRKIIDRFYLLLLINILLILCDQWATMKEK